jgi:hypothetical protein
MEYKRGSKLYSSLGNATVISDNRVLIQRGVGQAEIVSIDDFIDMLDGETVQTTLPDKSLLDGLLPIPLEAMQQSKAEEDEKKYKKAIKGIITNIYTQAVQAAKTGSSSYRCRSDPSYLAQLAGLMPTQFIVRDDTLTNIMNALRELFPGCRVTHSKMARGVNGQMHDISQMDELTTKLIEMKVININDRTECIVIDWS